MTEHVFVFNIPQNVQFSSASFQGIDRIGPTVSDWS